MTIAMKIAALMLAGAAPLCLTSAAVAQPLAAPGFEAATSGLVLEIDDRDDGRRDGVNRNDDDDDDDDDRDRAARQGGDDDDDDDDRREGRLGDRDDDDDDDRRGRRR